MNTKTVFRRITFVLLLILIISLFVTTTHVVAQEEEQTTYVVQQGDTLRVIALRYGTSWQAIANVNHLVNPNYIYVGQILVIPGVEEPNEPAPQFYLVQPGDSLRVIALRYGTTWQALAAANNLTNPNRIYAGTILIIPSPQEPHPAYYVVQLGDTLYRIALRYGVNMWELARANNILNLNRIYAGQTLVIP